MQWLLSLKGANVGPEWFTSGWRVINVYLRGSVAVVRDFLNRNRQDRLEDPLIRVGLGGPGPWGLVFESVAIMAIDSPCAGKISSNANKGASTSQAGESLQRF
ncbi:hypothetical protein DSO57_1005166 [Entomophthora muscae]|uniref:Uncharacterized protein n=1 Tax=Entomophthora muscae TaxID=34485 RepID=A0ACC2TWL9_9FUNG|nr:hypothetical protein DSO57_1005166 [Entomophthora muscae]